MPRIPLKLSKEAAKQLLNHGYNCHYQSGLESMGTALGGSGANLLHIHTTPTLLSSASLLAHHIKHRIIRNLQHINTAIIRRTEELALEKHPYWIHHSSQEGRLVQVKQALEQMKVREAALKHRIRFKTDDVELKMELGCVQEEIGRLKLAIDNMEPTIKGNLHPASLLHGERAFLTPSEAAQLPSPMGTIRGILVRIKGPRRGNRGMTWQKTAGRFSTNSVDYVAAEEAKVPIPSKLGIYGLTVRIVHCRIDRLVNPNRNLKVIDRPDFKFFPGQSKSNFH